VIYITSKASEIMNKDCVFGNELKVDW